MSFLFDTPEPPNPIVSAAAQTGSNVSTAVANQFLGNVNQATPQGNLSYDVTGNFDWRDPTTGQTYSIPRFTANQNLTPVGQGTFEESQNAQYNLALLGHQQAARLRQQFGTPFDISGAPAFGDPNTLTGAQRAQSTYGQPHGPMASFGDAGQLQRTYQHGDDFSADRQRIEAGLMERLNPSLAIERNKYEQQLADQGIRYGSPAYENAMRNYSMQSNDARLAAIAQGGQEQMRLSQMAREAGEFSNQAQQQAYEQLFGRGQFYNAGQQQHYSQEAQRATFANAALAQNFQQGQAAFNAQNAARQQYLNEQFALRDKPINEITALLSGSQVQQPNFLNTESARIPTTDVAGLINRNFDQQMAASNQQAATANNIIGGLFGFAGGMARGGAFTR